MAGGGYEWQELWILRWYGYGPGASFERRKPVRLTDRESLYGLIKDFETACGGPFTAQINHIDQSTTDVGELLDRAPRKIFNFSMRSEDGRYSLDITSLYGGRTSIDGPIDDPTSGLQRLMTGIEGRQVALRWYNRLNRFRIMHWHKPTVVVRWSRDVKAERRVIAFSTIAGAIAGLVAGLGGAILQGKLS